MKKFDGQKTFAGCGNNCACAQSEKKDEHCALPPGGVQLDKNGKCPCGKSKDDCCHSDAIESVTALHELCDEHNGRHVCDVSSDLQKAAP